MYNFLEGLRHGSLWAVKLYDATSYYGGGALGGASNVRIHNPNICRSLLEQYKNQVQHASWSFIANETIVPFAVQIIVGHYLLEIVYERGFKYERIQQLICFPTSCTAKDLQQILEVYLFQSNHVVRNITYLGHRALNDLYSIRNDTDTYVLIYYSFIKNSDSSTEAFQKKIGFIADYKNSVLGNIQQTPRKTTTGTDTVDIKLETARIQQVSAKNRAHKLDDILYAVSPHNVLYNVFVGDVTSCSLIYAIFTSLLIHEYLDTQIKTLSSNFGQKESNQISIPSMQYASFLIDVYFFVNVSPSFAFCTFAEHLLDKHFHNNIALEVPSLDYKTCKNRLINVLYIDTFFPLDQRCMPWTWFISLEMQFFIVSCLVLLLAKIQSTYASIIGGTVFLNSILAAIAWEGNPTTSSEYLRISHVSHTLKQLAEFNLLFDNIWLRILPYIIGICTGYIFQRTQTNTKIGIVVQICGWFAFSLTFGLFIFGHKYSYEAYLPGRWCQATFVAISHAMWSLMLLWITLNTEIYQAFRPLSSLLQSRYLFALDRLAPICLLIGPIVIRLLVFTTDAPIYNSILQTFTIFIGCLLVTYFCAFLLHFLFDGPLFAILHEAILK
ncbi:uncharacterized protein LOC110118911 [Ceratitis capitata]|uniref:uncharacterized protein LOC110118911 n=1 Tax=Ceratitis capitata TaxID=7213 RepID=UPI000A117AD2|nr:uncharacterized protein LOC110118911 [Ceratitis capitata]